MITVAGSSSGIFCFFYVCQLLGDLPAPSYSLSCSFKIPEPYKSILACQRTSPIIMPLYIIVIWNFESLESVGFLEIGLPAWGLLFWFGLIWFWGFFFPSPSPFSNYLFFLNYPLVNQYFTWWSTPRLELSKPCFVLMWIDSLQLWWKY